MNTKPQANEIASIADIALRLEAVRATLVYLDNAIDNTSLNQDERREKLDMYNKLQSVWSELYKSLRDATKRFEDVPNE